MVATLKLGCGFLDKGGILNQNKEKNSALSMEKYCALSMGKHVIIRRKIELSVW